MFQIEHTIFRNNTEFQVVQVILKHSLFMKLEL